MIEGWLIVLAVVLVAVAGLFASAETALARVSRVRVEELVRDRRRGARRLAEVGGFVVVAQQRRLIEPDEREMIHSVFELGDTLVREVMVPRTDMVFIERGKTLRQGLSLALRSGFSRIPVVGENEDDVIGIAYLKDIVARGLEHRDGES